MIKTFISHTSSDHPFVEWLRTKLERENLDLDIFVDDGTVIVGDDPQRMIDEVKKSIIFISILSNESVKKEFVRNELKTAIENDAIHIFPVKLNCDEENIPEVIKINFSSSDKVGGKIYGDFSDEKEWDIHYENLRKAIFNKVVELGFLREPTKDFYQDCEHLDLIIQREDPTTLEIKTVIDVYLKKEPYQRYFFSRLSNAKWLKYLKRYGYLKSNPQPIEAKDSPGYFTIPQWPALDYLEKVSKQISDNEEAINDLLEIIKSVTPLKDPAGQHIDNYRTWYYFVKILLNLPNDKITEEIINLIPIWLNSKFRTSLPASEIIGKLLPKLLTSNATGDWIKAGMIVEMITDVKWIPVPEKKRGIYGRDEEPITLVEPYWLIKAVEKNAARIGEICSEDLIHTIAKRILDILRRRYPGSRDVSYDGESYQITHALLGDGKHELLLHSLKYPDNWDGFSREEIEKNLVSSFILPKFTDENDFITTIKKALIDNIFPMLAVEFDEVLASVYFFSDYTYVGLNSLSTPPRHVLSYDAEKVLIYILKDLLLSKSRFNAAITKGILEKFLGDEYPYPIFKRLVLFVVGNEWEKYKEYFFRMIDEKEEIKYFEESDYAVELQLLLKDNISKFTHAEKQIIKKLIVAGPGEIRSDDPEKYVAYWKQKWLSLLKEDPEFASLFEEQKKISGMGKEKFTFGAEFRISKGFDPSSLSTEEILSMTNDELALKMKEFRSEKTWEGKTVAGLSVVLKEAVTANPKKFVEDLSPFEEVGFIYVYKIIDGVREAWKGKKNFNWGKLFEFLASYISKVQFWKDDLIVEKGEWLAGADYKWVIGIIAELVQEGTGDDSWAFAEEHIEKGQEIILSILDNLGPNEEKEINDYVFHVLNSPLGKSITALIYLALRKARVNDKRGIKGEPRWSEEFKRKFEELLNKRIIDAYTSLGRFLPYFSYLDKKWVEDKIQKMSSEKSRKYWEALMDGYLSMGKVYDDLYNLMKPHYDYGLTYTFKQKHNGEHLIQHICIGYLREFENLDDPKSLFGIIINAWRPDQISEVISFFWMQRDLMSESSEENAKMKGRIIEFWRKVYAKYKRKDEGSLTQEDKKILSLASKLAGTLLQIDAESYDWLMLSAPYVDEDFNSAFFIEYLDELKDKGSSEEVAKYIEAIYLKMLEKITPDYDKKHIRSIIEFLYNSGAHEYASKICNIYGLRGYEFLRDIYEKYNVSK